MSLPTVSPKIMLAGSLAAVSVALFIGSMVSYGLFISKGCSDSSAGGNFQKCNMSNIFISVLLFVLAAAVYFEKVELTEKNLVMLAGVVSLILFITGMVQYSALMNTVSCDSATMSTLKNWNMLVWMMAIICLVLSSYMYYQIYKEEQQLLQFKYFLRR